MRMRRDDKQGRKGTHAQTKTAMCDWTQTKMKAILNLGSLWGTPK